MTAAERLKVAGYATLAIGKWGLGLENHRRAKPEAGFDDWFGYLDQTTRTITTDDLAQRQWPLVRNADDKKGEHLHDFFSQALPSTG